MLPDFDTFQIIYFPHAQRMECGNLEPSVVQREQEKRTLTEEVKGMKDWAMDCLRKPPAKAGCREGDGEERKNTVLRVIELNSELSHLDPSIYLQLAMGSVRVEEYEM